MFTEQDKYGMQQAILCAERAKALGEVPIGAVLMLNNEVIASGCNSPISSRDPTAHAEIIALRKAAEVLGNYRLNEATLYVTLEPCVMCAGAIVHARVKRLIYAATDPRAGGVVSRVRVLDSEFLNHRVEHVGGLLSEECGAMLSAFFMEKRGV